MNRTRSKSVVIRRRRPTPDYRIPNQEGTRHEKTPRDVAVVVKAHEGGNLKLPRIIYRAEPSKAGDPRSAPS